MPFVKDGEKTRWIVPTSEEIRVVRDDILASGPTTNTSVPEEVRQRLARATAVNKSTNQGWNIIATSNKNLYNTIQTMTAKAPGLVDIILPVHNALHIVKPCIEAVLERTHWPYKLTIIDDASDNVTHDELFRIAKQNSSKVQLITNKKNRGFAATVNRGVKNTDGEYIVLLNSDVLVTNRWLTKMIMALKADSRNQIVCPATNNTAVVEIPMAQGASYLGMNRVLEQFAVRRYPEIIPTGFCFLFSRSLIEKIGLFDEAFKNFGEEPVYTETPVLTPNGWKTIGSLSIGDVVFDENGEQTKVVYSTPVFYNRTCYKLTFNEEEIIAEENHPWLVTLRDSQNVLELSPRVLTTRQLYELPSHNAVTHKVNITACPPLNYDKKQLPINPYLLGAWLGDGANHHGRITTGDIEIIEHIRDLGWKVTKLASKYDYTIGTNDGQPSRFSLGFGKGSRTNPNCLKAKLKALGLPHNKHIPRMYLESNFEDRLELLRGLMDTDGRCHPQFGRAEFFNTNRLLIEGVLELVRSLGFVATLRTIRPEDLSGHECYAVGFKPSADIPVFRVNRKRSRQREKIRRDTRYHKLIKVEKTHTVPVKCITVDSPSHLFLIGKSLVTTFNSDFWMKTISVLDGSNYPRYRAVMADDTYVFHERGSSYSALGKEVHMSLRRGASGRFHSIWPQFQSWNKSYNADKALSHIRQDIPANFFNLFKPMYRICWVVHSTSMCGGMKYIADIVNKINENGGDARVALIKRQPEGPVEVLPELRSAPVVFENIEHFLSTFTQRVFTKGTVVASTSELVPPVVEIVKVNDKLKSLLHVQSYEPDMVEKAEVKEKLQDLYKKIPNVISNSNWITKKLEANGVKPFATVSPGVDLNLFYNRGREKGDDRPTVMLSLNKSYEYRGYNRGLHLIQELECKAEELDIELRILAYGVETIPIKSGTICLGNIPQAQLAKILGTEVDVFVDPSYEHSYGMPALEALASGVTVVSWDNKGVNEYLQDGITGRIFVATAEPTEIATEILSLFRSNKKMNYIHNLLELDVLNQHRRDVNVDKFIEAVERKLRLSSSMKRIVFVTPHLRKHGGPTTIINYADALAALGHDVSISTVYSDINPEVVAMTNLPISTDAHNIPTCDLLITNSDNPMNSVFSGLKHVKKKIMLKLSHNERFKELEEAGLKQPWDAIVTTSTWLKEVCENPTEGWNYPAFPAKRIGWWHYGHDTFDNSPNKRQYNTGTVESPITIGFLVHKHPLKGTKETVKALAAVHKKYGSKVRFFGIGEVDPKQLRIDLPTFKYHYNLNRVEMANLFARLDVWVGASYTEGLGRLALEAMSAGAVCVLSDTNAEFAKNNHNCMLFQPGNTQKMAEKIDFLIQKPDVTKKIREAGYITAKSAADNSAVIENLSAVIEEVFND